MIQNQFYAGTGDWGLESQVPYYELLIPNP